MRNRTLTLALTCAALLTAGCSGGDDTGAPSTPHTSTTSAPTDDAAATTAADAASATSAGPMAGGRTPVEWAEAPRALTDTEKEFFYEPGAFAGSAWDQQAAKDAVLAMHPTTEDQWVEAILTQTQGDYVADMEQLISFDPSITDAAAGPTEGPARAADEQAVGTNHFAIVLDASGSMGQPAGGGTRMEEAKAAIETFVGELPQDATVSVRVYGHEGDNTDAGKKVSCASSDVLFEGEPDTAKVTKAIQPLQPTGWTPLADGIELAGQDIPADATDGIVYVVTDGLESCGGDPVKAAKKLAGSGIQPIVNVIGFQVGDADQAELKAIAKAGNGSYTTVETGAELQDYWQQDQEAMMQAWSQWQKEELAKITKEGDAKLQDVSALGQRLLTAVSEDGDHSLALASALQSDQSLDYDTGRAVWNRLYERKTEMWPVVYDMQTSGWGEAYNNRSTAWNDVYDTGTTKWSEYYRKSVEGH